MYELKYNIFEVWFYCKLTFSSEFKVRTNIIFFFNLIVSNNCAATWRNYII